MEEQCADSGETHVKCLRLFFFLFFFWLCRYTGELSGFELFPSHMCCTSDGSFFNISVRFVIQIQILGRKTQKGACASQLTF